MSHDNFLIDWIDGGRKPRNPPNPAYPNGTELYGASPGKPSCRVALPYPTGHENIGQWVVSCLECGCRVVISAASRPDDPTSITVPCQGRKGS